VSLFGEVASAQVQVVVGPISIPTVVSKRLGSKTPLMDTMVRRSSCLNPEAVDGYKVVRIKDPASKRRKKTVIYLDDPPKDASEVSNPIPLDNLQEWGVICGVSPRSSRRTPLCKGMEMTKTNDGSRLLFCLLVDVDSRTLLSYYVLCDVCLC
jgi:hypothetical protein